MSLYQQQQRLECLKRERVEAEALVEVEKEIAQEKELTIKARAELRRRNETLEQKAERLAFQRLQAVFCDCPEMDPDWRSAPLYSQR